MHRKPGVQINPPAQSQGGSGAPDTVYTLMISPVQNSFHSPTPDFTHIRF